MQKNHKLILGIGTDVGKTVTAAILVHLLGWDYWKPVQTGDSKFTDTKQILEWVPSAFVHPESYHFSEPVSPHYAAKLQGIEIQKERIEVPHVTDKGLVIEGCGGVLVPISKRHLLIDWMKEWNMDVVLVIKHYLGSINHSLLSIEAIQNRGLGINTIIFNGDPYPEAEELILDKARTNHYERILPESKIDASVIQKYARLWSFGHVSTTR